MGLRQPFPCDAPCEAVQVLFELLQLVQLQQRALLHEGVERVAQLHLGRLLLLELRVDRLQRLGAWGAGQRSGVWDRDVVMCSDLRDVLRWECAC